MTIENEWVKLPEPFPIELPEGTRMLRDGRMHTAKSVVRFAYGFYDGMWNDGHGGNQVDKGGTLIQLPPGYRFEGSEVVKADTVTCKQCSKECPPEAVAEGGEGGLRGCSCLG